MKNEEINKIIDDRVKKALINFSQASGFTVRKVVDNPTDALAAVNRKYVTLNGTSAQRPTSSVIGQSYFDNTLGIPVWWDGVAFVDAAGNVV